MNHFAKVWPVNDIIIAAIGGEDEHIDAVAAAQRIITGTAIDDIGTKADRYLIMTIAAVQTIIALTAVQHIIAAAAAQNIIVLITGNEVRPAPP